MTKTCCVFLLLSSALIISGRAAVIVPNIDGLSPGDSLGGNFPATLVFVVTVDGKSYFAEMRTRLAWSGASAHCKSSGMRLATITSTRQSTLLNQSYGSHFSGHFWTSGRDAHELRQFSWSETGEPIDSNHVELRSNNGGYCTCLYYNSMPGQFFVNSDHCIKTAGTLCETV